METQSMKQIPFENSEYPWAVQTSVFLLLCLLHVFQGWSKVKQLLKNPTQRFALGLDISEWQGVWNSMGKYLGQWASPAYWNFTLEEVQNLEKLVKHLEKVCCHPVYSREAQRTATCWGLAQASQVIFDIIHYPQEKKKLSESDDKTKETGATPTLVTGTEVTPTLVSGTAPEPGNQPVLVSVAPIHKK
ncbi:uncharacterized protein LOC127482463 isoform X2 [Manacus candei]|uniref:uncharacterized protein LOC127482463 isoform X2 n=1 Tax=Manacus candei TaxID=415023 RepID=UPI002227373F|nr:uncharacterized protein LOC127482463 isoform X2 [Manacus candei]